MSDGQRESLRDFMAARPGNPRRIPHYVYFVSAPIAGCIKIGIAVDPFERLATLQSGNPETLSLMGVMAGYDDPRRLEGNLHDRFRRHHVRGEWFRHCAELVAFIAEVSNGDGYEPFEALARLHEPVIELPDDLELLRPKIPDGVAVPQGGGRKAKMARYLLARGLAT